MDKMLQVKIHNLVLEVVVVDLFRFLQSTLMATAISALQEEMALLVEEEALVAELLCIS